MGAQPSSSSGASAPASSAPAYEHPPTGATATTGGGGSNGRHANRLCEGGEGGGPQDLEAYAIRLTPEQSLQLYGLWSPKRTLTWRDVLEHSTIYLGSCVRYGISPTKLNRMQPDIKLWIQYGKATVADCEHMLPWRPDPFKDLGCSIGDLVVYRRVLPPTLLIESGTTFAMLRDLHGLTPDLMSMLRYSLDEWIRLGLDESFLTGLTNDEWLKLFGIARRQEVLAQVRRAQPPPLKL